jgi:signal transduction histidine kinase
VTAIPLKVFKQTREERMSHSETAVSSISRRFSITFISVVTLLLVFFAIIVICIDSLKINNALEKRLDNALQLAYISLPTPLWNLDNTIVDDFIEALFHDEAMVYAEVTWGQEVIAKRVRQKNHNKEIQYLMDSSRFIYKFIDIFYEGNKVGTVRLVMSRESVKYQIAVSVLGIIALVILIIFAITITSLIITRRYITKPLLKLQSAASSIAQGNLGTVIEQDSQDEIGVLAQNLDVMRDSLKKLFEEVNSSKKKIEDYSKTLEQKVTIRTKELAQSVEELKALGEVSQAVNSTLDLDAVLSGIVRQSVILSDADGGTIFEFNDEEQVFIPKIHYGVSAAFAEQLQSSPILRGDKTAIGQAALTLSPVQIPDLNHSPYYPLPFVLQEGFRALLALPLVREKRLIGGLVIQRKEAGEFSARIVKLLQSFAAQSVLAIHNAMLFREIEKKSYQLEIADRHKSEFLANMSHELRTPLNAILGYTELLVDKVYGDLSENIEEILQRIGQNGSHLLSLINDILDLSKIEAGQFSLTLDDYSVSDVVQTVYTSMEALASEKNLVLTVDLPENLPIGRGDEHRLIQVLMNLLGNAIKFTRKGEINITVREVEESFLISVSDTGQGLSAADQDIIFKEFQQIDGSSTRENDGTGLGLSIAKKLVEMHGGRIWVESELGQGAVFRFKIPVRITQ